MKILTLVYSLGKGGTQRAAQNFAEAYLLNGHDSRLLATHESGIRHSELSHAGVDVWHNLTEKNLAEISLWNPDILHIHSHGLEFSDVKTLIELLKPKRVIETNVFSTPSPWECLVDSSFQLSEWAAWLYKKRSKITKDIRIVPYPIKTGTLNKADKSQVISFRRRHGISDTDILIGRVGQAYEGKWSPLLINMFNKLRRSNQNLRLILVNPPKSIIDLSKNSEFKESIVIIDSIEGDKNLALVYSAVDIFVLIADMGESFGMVSAESLLCETPVVTFSTPWGDNSQCEVVGNMIGGIVVTSRKALEEAIKKLVEDISLRSRLGSQGRERVIAKYEYRKIAMLALDEGNPNVSNELCISVPKLYYDSFGKRNLLAIPFLLTGSGLDYIRLISGYESFLSIVKRLIRKIKRLIKKLA